MWTGAAAAKGAVGLEELRGLEGPLERHSVLSCDSLPTPGPQGATKQRVAQTEGEVGGRRRQGIRRQRVQRNQRPTRGTSHTLVHMHTHVHAHIGSGHSTHHCSHVCPGTQSSHAAHRSTCIHAHKQMYAHVKHMHTQRTCTHTGTMHTAQAHITCVYTETHM